MAEVKWIKIVTDIFDNRKIKLIRKMPEGDAIVVTWFQLLCLAGEVNDNGLIYITKAVPYTEETLATAFDTPLGTIKLALDTFQRLEMVTICNSYLCVANWEKYQNIDALEKIREQNRLRKQRQREKQLALPECHVTVTGHVTQCHATDIDKEIDIDKERDKTIVTGAVAPKRTAFIPPTVEKVQAYCIERNNKIDPEQFVDHYTTNGWMAGRVKMKDWKAAVRNWERNSKASQTGGNYGKRQNRPVKPPDSYEGESFV